MLLRTTTGETRISYRGPFSGADRIPSWQEVSGWSQWSDTPVNIHTVMGLPAAGAAVRVISETIGMIPMGVYEGEDEPQRVRRRDVWQSELLHDKPNTDSSAFELFQDVAASIETHGDAFVFKIKVRRERVDQLVVIDPNLVRVRRNEVNRKVFDIQMRARDGKERTETFTSATVLHIRGWSLHPGADSGTSPIEQYRQAWGPVQALYEFQGRHLRNDARPGGVIEVPSDVGPRKLEEAREAWESHHAGPENQNRIGMLAFGARYREVGFSMSDTQFIEQRQFTVQEIARMFRVNASMLEMVIEGQMASTENLFERFLKLDLAPRLRRIESALRADPDLFPSESTLFPEFITDAVLRPDIRTRYEAYRLARQGGWMAINEIRQKENLPPAEGGDQVQQTPVGGAPNEDEE